MKKLHRSKIASALLATTAGASMLAVTEQASAQIEDELMSEVLIFPYYTVRDGWTTLANVTNPTPYTVVTKVRYRESYNSRDVLDFNVILSPQDVWTGWVAEGPNGPRLYTRDATCTTPIFETAPDGSKYADFSNLGYQNDGGPTGIDRAREGHFEIITMGQFYPGAEDEKWTSSGSVASDSSDWPPGQGSQWGDYSDPYNSTDSTISWSSGDPKYPTAYYAKHVDGKPRNCEMVDSRFEATAKPWTVENIVENGGFHEKYSNDGNPLAEWDVKVARAYWACVPGTGPGIDDCDRSNDAGEELLKGNFGLINTAKGIGAGAMAWAAEDWSVNYSEDDLITAQEFPWFLEPTLYSEDPEDDNGGLWGWEVDISRALADVQTQVNEWSTNARTGAMTDWVVTFPTKEFHVDISETDIYAGANPVRFARDENRHCEKNGGKWTCEIWGTSDPEDTFKEAFLGARGLRWRDNDGDSFEEYFGENADGQSCDEVVYGLYDREENGVISSGTSISPAPPQPTESLCYETNVLSFQEDSSLGSTLAIEVDTSVLTSDASAGWLRLELGDTCEFDEPRDDDYCDEEMPVIGFAFKSRDFGDPTRNFGVLMYNGGHEDD